MDSFEKFSDKKLPDKCEFFSFLESEWISETNYLHAINFWNMFKINAMSDYHDICFKTDVVLLADVFEKFINTCLEYYRLHSCH